FAKSCVDGLTAQPARLERYLLESTALATVLTPRFGYLKVAELLHESQRTGTPVKRLLVESKLLTEAEVEELLGARALARLAEPVP
ncbi:protein containing Fumarase C, partial [mine drainage metagenome]